MRNDCKADGTPRSFYSYLILGAAIVAFIQAFSQLSPILFSFLLILLVSLAVNPVLWRMHALMGGRKSVAGIILAALVVFTALAGWAFFGPMQDAVIKLSNRFTRKNSRRKSALKLPRPRRRMARPKPRGSPRSLLRLKL
jgi:predicted PurR-regulated permease PerM